MKRIKYSLMALVCMALSLQSCSDDQIIQAEQLPEAAKSYVKKTYPNAHILYAKKDADLFKTKYEVGLDNGLEIEFDADGIPRDIEQGG